MPNEFVARNGVIALNNSVITGSLNVTAGITGSLLGTASFATTASFVQNAVSASFATTASYVLNAVSASFATTASYVLNAVSASFATTSTSASFASTASSADNFTVRGTLTAQTIVAQTITSSTDFVTGSTRFGSLLANTHQFTGSVSMTGSLTTVGTASFNGPLQIDNSVLNTPKSITFVANISAGGNSELGSISWKNTQWDNNIKAQIQAATGTDITEGQLLFKTGASGAAAVTRLTISPTGNVGVGKTTANAILDISGSTIITGSLNVTQGITGSLLGTSSFATTASFIQNAVSASFATTASYVLNAVSASFASTASFIPTSSLTGNFFVQGGNSFGAQAVLGTNDVQNLALETNGSTRMFISSGGNVGIGTTSSLANFQVGNSSALANYQGGLVGMILPTGSGTWIELADNSTNGTAFRISKDSGAGIIFNANGREIGLKADSYSTTMTDAQLILKTSGNVGIGKTTPNAKLDISGSAIITGSLNVTAGITGSLFGTASFATSASFASTASFIPTSSLTGNFFVQGGNSFGAQAVLGTNDVQNLAFETSGSVRMTISGSNGNVGIGTITPGTKLEIQDAALDYTSAEFNSQIITTTAQLIDRGGSLAFGGQTGTTSTQFGAVRGAKENSTSAETGGYLSFMTRANGGPITDKMRITSAGNVGIGTTSPSQKLDVNGKIKSNSSIFVDLAGSDTVGVGPNFTVSRPSDAKQWIMQLNASAGLDFWNYNGAAFNRRMTINEIGNLGIGTTTPNATLDVSGSAIITGSLNVLGSITTTGTLTAQTLVVQTITSSTDFVTGSTRFGSLLANTHQFTGSVSMTGSLAVTGTTTISTSLTNPLLIGGTTTTSTITYQPTSGVGTTGADHIFKVGNNGATEAMRILNNGNVGIGLSPTGVNGKLQVTGSIGLSGNSEIRQNTNSDGSTLKILATQVVGASTNSAGYGYSGGGVIASVSAADSTLLLDAGRTTSTDGRFKIANTTSSNTSLSLEKNGVYTLFASTSGNVGIGTGTPNAKLDVSGSLNISGSGVQVPLQVSSGSTSLLFVSQSGNVGIGTTSPAYKLDVSGSARVQSGLVAPLLFNRITGSYTLVLADQGKMIEANSGSSSVITVPQNANVAFPIGTEISVVMRNTGTVQIVGETGIVGVAVYSAGSLDTISTQYGAASLVKVDTNEWYLYGNLT